MPMREIARLLELASQDPRKALHASAGRLREVEDDSGRLRGVYAPHPRSDEYLVIVNRLQRHPELIIRQLVRHHVESHDRTRSYLLGAGFTPCNRCLMARIPVDPLANRARALRRHIAN